MQNVQEKDAAGREADDRARQLPRREDPLAPTRDVKRGRVISQKPKLGTVLPSGGKVNLVVSRGRRPA